MPAKVLCAASAKGGSGKTIITAALGHFLGAMKKRVLMIDTDAATNGLTLFYLNEVVAHRDRVLARGPERQVPAGIFDLARQQGGLSSVSLGDGIEFLPATYRAFNTEDVSAKDFSGALHKTLHSVFEKYDFILLDAQAGSDSIAQVSISSKVSDQVVLVSEYDPLSAAGAERLKSLFPDDLSYERTWILVNKMLPEFASSLGDFLQVARYLPPIPWDADVVRAYAQRSLAVDFTYGNDYTLAVISTAKGLLGPAMAKEIDQWVESRASALKAPIKQQLRDLELEADGLVIEGSRLQRRRSQIRIRRASLAIGTALLLGAIAFLLIGSPIPLLALLGIAGVVLYLLGDEFAELDPLDVGWKVRESEIERQERHIDERMKRLQLLVEADPAALLESRTKIPQLPD